MTAEKNLEGLRGWLILLGISVVFSPLRNLFETLSMYPKIFSSGRWESLTTPGSEAYHPLWAPTLIGELAVNIGLILSGVFIAFLFFSKKKAFPKWYIATILFVLVTNPLDVFLIHLIKPNKAIFDAETTAEFVRTLIVCVIWIPYLFISKRVKATFIH